MSDRGASYIQSLAGPVESTTVGETTSPSQGDPEPTQLHPNHDTGGRRRYIEPQGPPDQPTPTIAPAARPAFTAVNIYQEYFNGRTQGSLPELAEARAALAIMGQQYTDNQMWNDPYVAARVTQQVFTQRAIRRELSKQPYLETTPTGARLMRPIRGDL